MTSKNSRSKAIICDLDNCLVDDSARIPLIDLSAKDPDARYNPYHAAMVFDGPADKWMLDRLAEHAQAGLVIVFCTARPERFCDETAMWLGNHVLPRLRRAAEAGNSALRWRLMMRRERDHRDSVALKFSMLLELTDPNNPEALEVLFAYDDRPDVLEMYDNQKIQTRHHFIHTLDAYKPPPAEAPALPRAGSDAEYLLAVVSSFGPEAPVEFSKEAWGKIHMAISGLLGAAKAEAVPSPVPAEEKRAPDFLEAGAATFRQRNAVYGDTYLNFGPAMAHAFPNGLRIEPGDADGFNRLGILVQCLGKLLRYAPNLAAGGHTDSAHDLMVYAAMLEEVTKEPK